MVVITEEWPYPLETIVNSDVRSRTRTCSAKSQNEVSIVAPHSLTYRKTTIGKEYVEIKSSTATMDVIK